ncbi:hypothetical protein VN97_g9268 [Penicillium thymicola]|uniref:Uncharacterized protein n=1 Tax=Penicillium thymicola TaxID=293382 RepID=A0AAI9TB86_PENTH|nr:hypothetical protein VN97_g9268 [Penicillium thymicola]
MSTFLCVILSTGGLSNSCTKTYHWRRLLSIIPLPGATFSICVSRPRGGSYHFIFPCFFFFFFFFFFSFFFFFFFFAFPALFLFILLSLLICCGYLFVSRSVARTLVFSLISFVSESQMSNYIMMEWNEMRYSRAFLILLLL